VSYCPTCHHLLGRHRIGDGRCLCRRCDCVNPAVMVAPEAASPIEAREAWLAEPAERLVRMGLADAVDYLRAAWDAGFLHAGKTSR
jgi:hypothetical protein